MVHVTIPGTPFCWKRTRGNGKVRFEDPAQKAWKAKARVYMLQAIGGRQRPVFPSDPVEVRIYGFWKMPGKPTKRGRLQKWKATRGDFDNLAKAFCDASEGYLVTDDAQYVRALVEKWYAGDDEAPRTSIMVRGLK